MSSARLDSLGTSTEMTRKKKPSATAADIQKETLPSTPCLMLIVQGETKASSTLEFVQRAFRGINSQTGSKAEKRHKLNAHVCTLLRKLLDFDLMG
ncbi:hypothetical protein QQF64_024590 [Cirrhinus molitorella]|uniref:Uncharacterized protein n=1 Tax=Cirrhinus molitorella TaxID=172907 RepID=A0ABR3NMD5_9TELE